MVLLQNDTGCCGANFNKQNISFMGLLSLSLPLWLISTALLWLLFPLSSKSNLKKILSVLKKSNLQLIEQKKILAPLKCQIAGRLFRLSPQASGLLFKNFNLIVLGFLALGLITSAAFGLKLWL